MGCFAYCAQCAFDRLRAMRFGDFGIECAYGAIYAKSRVTAGAGCAGKNLAMLCSVGRLSLQVLLVVVSARLTESAVGAVSLVPFYALKLMEGF